MVDTVALASLLAQATNNPVTQSGGGNAMMIWAVILLGASVALFVIEVFVPSGGLIGVLSAAAAVAGVVLMFWQNTTLGVVTLIVVLAALPFAVGLALAVWPNTWFAQVLTLKTSQRPLTGAAAKTGAAEADGEAVEGAAATQGLIVGQRGRALTVLRPVGTCVFDGQRHDCLADRGAIERGVEVEVISIDGMQIRVRAVEAA